MLLLRRIVRKRKERVQTELTRENLVNFFQFHDTPQEVILADFGGYEEWSKFNMDAEQLADECLLVTKGVSDRVPKQNEIF